MSMDKGTGRNLLRRSGCFSRGNLLNLLGEKAVSIWETPESHLEHRWSRSSGVRSHLTTISGAEPMTSLS